jgi:hypothetical protein
MNTNQSTDSTSKKRDTPSDQNLGSTAKICSICTEEIKGKRAEIECGHTFCLECIQQWASIENTCPYCKREFTKIFVKEKVLKANKPIYKRKYKKKVNRSRTLD